MAQTNDKRIMDLRAKIELKKKEIGKKERFSPITNCQVDLFGVRYNIHTFDQAKSIDLLVKLNALFLSAKNLGVEEAYEISGYNVSDWISDLQLKIRLLSKDAEQKKLDELEKQLRKLLSEDKKVELELDSIEGLLG